MVRGRPARTRVLPAPHPRMVAPYSRTQAGRGKSDADLIMPDKGKAERFIRYLRESFWVPLSSRLAQEGLIVDRRPRTWRSSGGCAR
jgi:hypothetical protein